MSALVNPAERKRIEAALSEWSSRRGIPWTQTASAYLDSIGVSEVEAGRIMHEFVLAGGEIDRVVEKREGWKDEHRLHYDLRLELCSRETSYVEMRLIDESRMSDPYLFVVSAKKK